MKISEMTTQTIMVYAEMVTKLYDDLNQAGGEATLLCSWEGITEDEKKRIQDELAVKMDSIESARIELVKEINSRMKKSLGISFGPSDLQPLLNKYIKRHPLFGKGEAEVKAFVESQKNPKAKMKKA